MRIIAKRHLMEMASAHGDCVEQVKAWYQVASKEDWGNLVDVRAVYPHADLVGDKTVFNIKGNHYRLIVHINYGTGIIYIKRLLTHAEYDKGTWEGEG